MDETSYDEVALSISDCQRTLTSITSTCDSKLIVVIFKKVVRDLMKCLESLKNYLTGVRSRKQFNSILLCLSQIHKCLPLLLNVIENSVEDKVGEPRESKRYVIERIHWCLSDILASVGPDPDPNDNECGSKFVYKMDMVLEVVTSSEMIAEKEDQSVIIDQLKSMIDELLCHAMTIAQISESCDYQAITSNSQKVLKAYDQLKTECESSENNLSMWRLFVNSLADSLEALEQRVNTSVLKLVLQVFSEPYTPLKSLVQCCTILTPATERDGSDLDDKVVELDLRMDRIMQIGLFAMACTGDANRVLSIRSCLASLESLEPELVPTVTAFYLDPTNVNHRNHLKLLTDHWQAEVATLHALLDAIIDPAAFGQVALDEVNRLSLEIKASIESGNVNVIKENVHHTVQRTKKLVRHLQTTQCELGSSNQTPQLLETVQKLNIACHECETCVKQVFDIKDSQDKSQWKRVLKRCQLIASTIKKILPLLLVLSANSSLTDDKKTKNASSTKSSADGEQEKSNISKNGYHCLLPYLDAGKVLRQERSIMYTTPKRLVKMSVPVAGEEQPPPKSHKRLFNNSLIFRKSIAYNQTAPSASLTLGLDITAVLDNLTLLCDTLSSLPSSAGESQEMLVNFPRVDGLHHKNPPSMEPSVKLTPEDVLDAREPSASNVHVLFVKGTSPVDNKISIEVKGLGVQESPLPSIASFSENSSCDMNTFDRLNDLHQIEKKLEVLKDQLAPHN